MKTIVRSRNTENLLVAVLGDEANREQNRGSPDDRPECERERRNGAFAVPAAPHDS